MSASRENHGWLQSRVGAVTLGALGILGFLIYTGHSAHLLGFVPYLFLLACPLMHLFMHSDHHHHHDAAGKEEGQHSQGGCCGGTHDKKDDTLQS